MWPSQLSLRNTKLEYALVSQNKAERKKNLPPRAQTTCLVSFGPVIAIAGFQSNVACVLELEYALVSQ